MCLSEFKTYIIKSIYFAIKLPLLNVNKYATIKSAAQGLLDMALLAANASQLKSVLQVGEKYEFYTLLLSLIIVSIVLQVSIRTFKKIIQFNNHSK